MSSSVGLLEFYILEAGEYVDRLDTLLAVTREPFEYVSPEGWTAAARYTRDERIADCAYCRADTCTQLVLSRPEWDGDVIVHNGPREFS
jgi:hypothetical protein